MTLAPGWGSRWLANCINLRVVARKKLSCAINWDFFLGIGDPPYLSSSSSELFLISYTYSVVVKGFYTAAKLGFAAAENDNVNSFPIISVVETPSVLLNILNMPYF